MRADAPAGGSQPGRVLGLDLGEVRVGVALSSSDRRLALAHEVLDGTDEARLVDAVRRLVDRHDVRLVVVGIPLSLSGARGRAAAGAAATVARLREALPVPVVGVDERLSTVEVARRRQGVLAARDRQRRGGRGGRRGASSERARPVLDDEAAALVLQTYLDAAARATGTAGG